MSRYLIFIGILLLNLFQANCIEIRQKVLQETRNNDLINDNNKNHNPFKPPKEIYNDPITASKIARKLVSNNTIAMINTKYEYNNETLVMSLPEYSIDCFDNGNPILLMIQMSHTFKNINNFKGFGSSVSYIINEESNDEYWPGATQGSMYGKPRVNLRGYFRELIVNNNTTNNSDINLERRYISNSELETIKKCFISHHKESGSWFPNNNQVHASLWTEFVVEGGYFVGGFGGYAYIGELQSSQYHQH